MVMDGMDATYRYYLALLGLDAVRADFDGLKQVVRRHLITVPFENISKRLYGYQGATTFPDLDTWLHDIEAYRFGGTCYANNYHLYGLLRHLDFDIRLCGADMAHRQDVHLASMVVCEGREYIVDCGFGAPFFQPLPRDLLLPQVISLGKERFVVQPQDSAGMSRVEQYESGELRYGYALKPVPRELREFRQVIADSYAADAFFMKKLCIMRFSEHGSVSLRNQSLTHNIDGTSATVTVGDDQLPGVVQDEFGIPADIVLRVGAGAPSHTR
jgi:N-hydroxyarylamine O-acetyltransferase